MSTSKTEPSHKHQVAEKGTHPPQTIENYRHSLIDQLRQEETGEDTEHVIDWLEDSWATFDMLKECFGEARAWKLYTSDPSPVCEQANTDRRFPSGSPMHDECREGASYATVI